MTLQQQFVEHLERLAFDDARPDKKLKYKYVHKNVLPSLLDWFSPLSDLPVDARKYYIACNKYDMMLQILEKIPFDNFLLCLNDDDVKVPGIVIDDDENIMIDELVAAEQLDVLVGHLDKLMFDPNSDNYFSTEYPPEYDQYSSSEGEDDSEDEKDADSEEIVSC